MDKKNTAIIATVATALLCGCPGLFGLCFGLMFAVISQIPGAELDTFGNSDPKTALTTGLISVCVGIVFIIIPIVVGVVTLRKKSTDVVDVPPATVDVVDVPPTTTIEPHSPDEPMPPAI